MHDMMQDECSLCGRLYDATYTICFVLTRPYQLAVDPLCPKSIPILRESVWIQTKLHRPMQQVVALIYMIN